MGLPPFQKLNSPDALFSRGQDNVASSLRALGQKQLVILGETALLLEATVTVPSDWTAVTVFQNSWVNFDITTNPGAQYRKTVDGMVEIIGTVKDGVATATAFTLPVGYRPSLNCGFAVASNNAFGEAVIDSSGNVIPYVADPTWFDFGCVRFPSASRTPVASSCWPVQLPCTLPARPEAVLLASAVETASGASVAAANPDWDWETQQGVNFVIINNVPLLPPGAEYDLTFLAIGEQ